MPLVETHAHLYSEDESRYPPAPNPHRPPPGTGSIPHLQRLRQAVGVTHVVAVQTFSFYGHDNRLLLATVGAHPEWMTGVVNLPSGDPSTPRQLERLAGPGVRGFRLEHPRGGGAFYHPGAVAVCRQALELGLVVNIHANGTAYLPDAARLLAEFPDLPFCLDHCGYLRPGETALTAGILELARFPNLHAKISFYAESGAEYVALGRQVVKSFGPDRCMWGGNFPGELWHPRLDYAEHLAMLRDRICTSPAEREAILDTTPMRLWFP